LKKALIISPHFPPFNAPDMQRVRMSLPYYKVFGWDVEVVTVLPKYVESFRDQLLEKTTPENIKVHYVEALPFWLTRKFGLGSLSIRSFVFYFFKVNQILKKEKFDLIYFSTTMFHVGALGAYWKKRFDIPYIIDLQDPWRNDYYLDKPKNTWPPKFRFAYQLLKWTEAVGIPNSSGVISVSEGYLKQLRQRYPSSKSTPMKVIPFGASKLDFEIVKYEDLTGFQFHNRKKSIKNVVYVGAITPSFIPILRSFFKVLLENTNAISNYHFYFIGTSYSTLKTEPLVSQLADTLGISEIVTEQTERIPYFEALATLTKADILFIPGSLDFDYNASKVYNAIISKTPIFSIFHNQSEVKKIIEKSNSGVVIGFNDLEDLEQNIKTQIIEFLQLSIEKRKTNIPREILAEFRTEEQCLFFNLSLMT
jgi:hypothetical protein